MKSLEVITGNESEFLKFLKNKFTLIHLSNIFFRDFHYGVMTFLREKGIKLKYHDAEKVAAEAAAAFERKGIFKKIDHQSWLLTYPEFALPRVEKKAPAAAQ
ncbi:MAG TPA: hypothetical protein VI215_09025 [Bacteroidota bacterium]|jgi:hypothetical protein